MVSKHRSKTVFSFFDKRTRLIVMVGLVFTLAMGGVYLYRPNFYAFIERQASDALLIQTYRERTSGIPVVVDIDAKAQAEYGPWPWPRHRLARLLEKIEQLGAHSIGLDMVLSEEDHASPKAVREQWYRDWGVKVEFEGLSDRHHQTDEELAAVLEDDPHALGYYFEYGMSDSQKICGLHPLLNYQKGAFRPLPENLNLRQASGTFCNLELFCEVARGSGFLDHFPDPDGVIREMPLIISHRGELFPSLALATLMQHLEFQQIEVKTAEDGSLQLVVGDFIIPIDQEGDMKLHFRGRGRAFDYISAADVLADNVEPTRLKGKIVFVGPNSTGKHHHRATPFGDDFPMVELHATVVDNILTRDHIYRPEYAMVLELGLMLVFGLLATLLISRAGSKWSVAVLVLCVFGIWGGAHWLIRSKGIMISPIAPMIAIAGNFIILILLKYSREERRLKKRNRELTQTQAAAIRGLATLAETRDPETGGHILRTQRYVSVLARHLKQNPKFAPVLDDEIIDQYFHMAPLHEHRQGRYPRPHPA